MNDSQHAQQSDARTNARTDALSSEAKIVAERADRAEHKAQNKAQNKAAESGADRPAADAGGTAPGGDTEETQSSANAGGSALPGALEPVGRYRLPWVPFFRIPIAVEGRGGDLFEITLTRHEAEVLYRHWCTMRREMDECRRMNSVGSFTLQMGPCSLERMGHLERVLDLETAKTIYAEVYAGFNWEQYHNWGASAAGAAAAAPDEEEDPDYEADYDPEDHG